jgi:hypothetical protein
VRPGVLRGRLAIGSWAFGTSDFIHFRTNSQKLGVPGNLSPANNVEIGDRILRLNSAFKNRARVSFTLRLDGWGRL